MPWGRGRLFEREFGSPVQQVMPLGFSGEGLNPFTAPSKWRTSRWVGLLGAYQVVVPAVANKAIRLYRYYITLDGPAAGVGIQAAVCYGGAFANLIHWHSLQPFAAALFVTGFLSASFAPTGIAWGINQALNVYTPAAGGVLCFSCQYSLEPSGSWDDGN